MIILSTLACLTVAIFAVSQIIIAGSYNNLEAQKTRENVRRAQSAIYDQITILDSVARDLARRDDTFRFIQTPGGDYIDSTLHDRFFSDFSINFVLFLNKSGELVYSKGFDVGSNKEVPLEASLSQEEITGELPVFHTGEDNITYSGIVMLPESPAVIASYPILTSQGRGPNQGTLIIGHYLDSTRIKNIADSTFLYHLNIYPFTDNTLPDDVVKAAVQLDTGLPIAVSPLNDDYVAGYTLLNDIHGNPGLILKVDEPRTIHLQGITTSHYFTYTVIIVGAIFTIIIMLLLEKQVLSRLSYLRWRVSKIDLSQGTNARINLPGHDEFADLSGTIDQMLERLEGSLNDLRLSEKRYRSILESIEEGYFELDLQGQFTVVNDALCQCLGYSHEEMIGRRLRDYINETFDNHLNGILTHIRLEHEPVKWLSWQTTHRDGSRCHIGMSIYPMLESDGSIVGFRGVARDVSGLVKVEEALRESEEKFSKAFRASPDCMAITTLEEGKYIEINDAYTRVTGYTRDNIIGRKVIDINRWDEANARETIMKKLKTKGRVLKEECRFRMKSGAIRTMLYSAETLKIGGVDCVLSVTTDITDRKRQEEQLLQTSKLASIGELASGVAHEVNNPLTSIIGYAQLLSANRTVPPDVKADLDKIYKESQRAAKIVQNLLSFARQHKPDKSAHSINDLVKQTLELRAYEHKTSDITVTLDLGENLPPVMADYHQIQQTILNIVINAEHAIAEVRCKGGITVSTSASLPFVRITISDNGCGIKPENMSRIFDPFFTTKDVNKGTGLGLSICHGIISEHGGKLYAESVEGKGTSFYIELPVAETAPPLPIEKSMVVTEPPEDVQHRGRILIIDDEPGIREVIQRILAARGYTTTAAGDGRTGLSEIARNGYDLCIVDMKMPDMSGKDIFEYIKNHHPEYVSKIIFVTGDTVTSSTNQYLQTTGRPFLNKPFSYHELLSNIEKCLADRKN
jgi:PAS domain S-box-containing protein